MLTICADQHEELVHTGDCPACRLVNQLAAMGSDLDTAVQLRDDKEDEKREWRTKAEAAFGEIAALKEEIGALKFQLNP